MAARQLSRKLCLTFTPSCLYMPNLNFPYTRADIRSHFYDNEATKREWKNLYNKVYREFALKDPNFSEEQVVSHAEKLLTPLIRNEGVRAEMISKFVNTTPEWSSSLFEDVVPFFEEKNSPDWPWDETVIFVFQRKLRAGVGVNDRRWKNGDDTASLKSLGFNIGGEGEEPYLNNPLPQTPLHIDRMIPLNSGGYLNFIDVRRALTAMRPDNHDEFCHLFVTLDIRNESTGSAGALIRRVPSIALLRGDKPATFRKYDPADPISFTDVEIDSVSARTSSFGMIKSFRNIPFIGKLSELKAWRLSHMDETRVFSKQVWYPFAENLPYGSQYRLRFGNDTESRREGGLNGRES